MGLQRAAIFGGTFDPVHNGHVEAARRVHELFAIERMIFVPACVPPHKRNANIASAYHRFAMLALAIETDAQFTISTVELDHPDRPYAIDTVERLQADLGVAWRLFFLMGADSWAELSTWREWQRLLKLCSLIVVTRPGYELCAAEVDAFTKVSDVRGMDASEASREVELNTLGSFFTDAVSIDVSATEIRSAVRAGDYQKLKGMVPAAVANYIEKHRLYRK